MKAFLSTVDVKAESRLEKRLCFVNEYGWYIKTLIKEA
jgi:hypothetical protein